MFLHWVTLNLTDGIGPILSRRIIEQAGSVEEACLASVALLRTVEGIGISKASKVAANLVAAREKAKQEIDRASAKGIGLITPDDAGYPLVLKTIPDPPLVLYCKGQLEPRDLNAIAIVGSRKCSQYGREQADRFGALLAGTGFTVVSGGARGIDTAAHRGAMTITNGRTIAVLGSGLDVPYPPENVELFQTISKNGAVLSEFPLGTPPVAENFPRRNRIVSGMSRGVLVIEADERSGALITARQAADEHDRTVMAIPGRLDNPLSAGTHKLIRQGAILVTRVEHILEAVGPLDASIPDLPLFDSVPATPEPAVKPQAGLSSEQQQILAHMTPDAQTVDAITDKSGLDVAVVIRELMMLSLKGRVRRVDGQQYMLIR